MPDRSSRLSGECFLCSPDAGLTYAENSEAIALCGLGPLVEGYSVLASHDHVRSAADFDVNAFVRFAVEIREKLISKFGSCLLTEHGRLPVCDYVSGRSESHCFHAHFLLFPSAPDVERQSLTYFQVVAELPTLAEALATGRTQHEYFLLSPDPNRFLVLTGHRQLPRQFARLLVANALGIPQQADWKAFPARDTALRMAAMLRKNFESLRG